MTIENKEAYVLDDDPISGKVIKKVLERKLGILVTLFHDPVTMLDNLTGNRPEAIIVDFYGKLKGDKVIKKVREVNKDGLIIMVSGDDNKENMMECLKAGANNVLLKESIIALPSMIQTHLNVRNSPRYSKLKSSLKFFHSLKI